MRVAGPEGGAGGGAGVGAASRCRDGNAAARIVRIGLSKGAGSARFDQDGDSIMERNGASRVRYKLHKGTLS